MPKCKKLTFRTMEEAAEWGKHWFQVAYLCPLCGWYHCTKSARADQDGARARAAIEMSERQDRVVAMRSEYEQAKRRSWRKKKHR